MIEASEYTFDFAKMFFGDYGLYIYLEILIRVLIIMTYTILILKWVGKRVVGGLGSADILILIAMGGAVGDAMLYPSIPLLVSLTAITFIASVQKAYVMLSVKSKTVRKKTIPTIVKLVERGELMEENFTEDTIVKNEVLMLLRESGIRYLSEVEHAYYEQSGQLSVFKYKNPEQKNSILPENIEDSEVVT